MTSMKLVRPIYPSVCLPYSHIFPVPSICVVSNVVAFGDIYRRDTPDDRNGQIIGDRGSHVPSSIGAWSHFCCLKTVPCCDCNRQFRGRSNRRRGGRFASQSLVGVFHHNLHSSVFWTPSKFLFLSTKQVTPWLHPPVIVVPSVVLGFLPPTRSSSVLSKPTSVGSSISLSRPIAFGLLIVWSVLASSVVVMIISLTSALPR